MGTGDMAFKVKATPPAINEKIRQAFHHDLAQWYERSARDLPWRRTLDPYAIAVSELMLQQTQVVTVIPYFERWLKKFPDWHTLAEAPEQDLLKAWEGLGYYTRVRNLQKLARQVMERGGQLPSSAGELRALAGIGPYTAGAISSLAFGQRAALVDGNVMRVFARVFAWSGDLADRSVQQAMWHLAEALLPAAEACARHNSALMELGATLCTPRQPQCLICPLRGICQATEPELLPIKTRIAIELKREVLALIEDHGRWWLEPGPASGRLMGFWRFPELDAETMQVGSLQAQFTYGITRYRVRLSAYRATWKTLSTASGRWFTPAEMMDIPMSSAGGRLRASVQNL